MDDSLGDVVPALPSRPSTIYDVARIANVSVATVSRYLAGFEGIRPATRERVEKALASLRYKPNLTARSLSTNRSQRIGALVYEIVGISAGGILQGAIDGARNAGYLLDIVSLDPDDPDSIRDALNLLDQQDLAGIFANAPTERLRQAILEMPFVVPLHVETEADDELSGQPPGINGVGTGLLMDHLLGLGHEKILHISGPSDWMVARNRQYAYRRSMIEHGLDPLPGVSGDWSAWTGYNAIEQLTARPEFTAILADNDEIALGAMRALSLRGIRVPEDISVVGFDDNPASEHYTPPLTTVRQDFHSLGLFAADTIVARINGTEPPVRRDYEHIWLVERESASRFDPGTKLQITSTENLPQ